jgi:UDP-N-acetylmuramoyl-tripeptide--D-alanyl-D-alanine ligase
MGTTIPKNGAAFTAWELATVSGGDLTRLPDERLRVVGLVTDSRAILPGNGFVAVRGATFDGHDFLAAAMAAGATAVVVERGRVVPEGGIAVVEVDDAVDALGRIAQGHLQRWRRAGHVNRRVAALTGSAGKTTTKELVLAIVSAVGPCHGTTGNLNNRIGVPVVALGVRDETYAVFELGMSVPREIAALTSVVLPDVAALLNVGVAHAEGFGGSRSAIAREKGAIFERLSSTGTAVVNADDEAARAQLLRTNAEHVCFGASADADVRLMAREAAVSGGSQITVNRRGEAFDVFLPVVGEAAAFDLLAAIAIADATVGHAIPSSVIAASVGAWQPPAGRSVARQLEGDVLVIDDSYNANPASMRAALATLAEIRRASRVRAVAVLGEMRELGPISLREHEELGAELARHRIDLVIGCGGSMDAALRHAEALGVTVRHAADADAAGRIIAAEARGGDVVLFKGSRGVAVERAVAALVARYPLAVAGKTGSP